MITTVHFDRPLHQLHPSEAEPWKAWLIQHDIDAQQLVCPSTMKYDDRKHTLTVDTCHYDRNGLTRETKRIQLTGPVLPFPAGYQTTNGKG